MIAAAQSKLKNRKTPALKTGAFHNLCFRRARNHKAAQMTIKNSHHKNNAKNVVDLFPRATDRNFENENRFETPFLHSSRPDGSPLTITVSGELAKDIRFDALAVGKEPADYAAQGLEWWYRLDGGAA